MGSGAERIALQLDSRADTSGVREMRTETTGLGTAVKEATEKAAAGQQKLTATMEQSRRAVAEAGGDMQKLGQILAHIVAEENNLAAAATKASTQLKQQAATGALAGPTGPQLGPALPGLTTAQAAAASAAAVTGAINKIPPAARQAGNSLGLLAAAAASGSGSISGLATAAGNVAQGMLVMSTNARFAASAAGIGVLIAAIGVLIGLAIEAKRALNDIPEGKLSQAAADHYANLKSVQQVNEEIARVDARRAALADGMRRGDTDALQANVNLGAQIEALYKRRVAITNELREKAKETDRAAEQRAKTAAEKKRLDNDYVLTLSAAAAAANIALDENEFRRRRELIENEAISERQAAEKRRMSDDDMKAALDEINRKRLYSIQLVEREAAVAKRKVTEEGLQGYAKLSAAVKNHGTVVGAMAKASADAVRLYEIAVQGKKAAISAKVEWAAAMAAFGSGNVAGGALHLAAAGGYAAAAVAAGAEAAGVVSGGGGGGGAGGGGDAASSTFQPRDANGGSGAQTIVLQTVNPFSKEVISEAIYQINRSNTLKRPILIAPTTGLVGAA
jgi:hypothetical protein